MRLSFRTLILSLPLIFLLACPGGDPSSTCKTDDDCPSKSQPVCCKEKGEAEGVCKAADACKTTVDCKGAQQCQNDKDCRNGEKCANSCCKKVKVVECKKHADCQKGEECVLSGLKKICRTCFKQCKSTTECATPGTKCENGCCRLPSCESDEDCAERDDTHYCNKETGECVSCTKDEQCQKDDPKSICRDNTCETVQCTKDEHCTDPKLTVCNLKTHQCDLPVICKTDQDCTEPDHPRCDPTANGGRGECKKGHCQECTNDDECGGQNDFCVGKDKGLKDGRRCLTACQTTKDCPQGFFCDNSIVSGFKVCFPAIKYCIDPCRNVHCKNNYDCVEGKCVKRPEPCDPCKNKSDCGLGNDCIDYGNGHSFCGLSCKADSDCPKSSERHFTCLNGQCFDENGCQP